MVQFQVIGARTYSFNQPNQIPTQHSSLPLWGGDVLSSCWVLPSHRPTHGVTCWGPSHTPRDLLAEIFSYPDIYSLRCFRAHRFTCLLSFPHPETYLLWVCPPLWPWWVSPTFSLLQLERTKGLSIESKGIEVRVLLEWHFQRLVFLDPASQKASSRFLSHVSCFLLRLWDLWKTKKSCTSGSVNFELLMTARIYSQLTSADLGPFEPGWPSPNSLSTYTRFFKKACNRHQSNPVLGPSFRPFKSFFQPQTLLSAN